MKRILLDCFILTIFLLTLSFSFLPKLLHEVLGLLLPIAVVLHLVWNRSWFSALRRGKWTWLRSLQTVCNALLIVGLFIVLGTGVCLSNHLFKDMIPLYLQRNMTLHQLHVSLPYGMLLLVGLHLGLHWHGWWERFLQKMGWQRSTWRYRAACLVAVLGLLGSGIYGSFLNRVGDRLLMKHIFATEATKEPFAVFFLLLLGIMALYAVVGFYARQFICKKEFERKGIF